MTVTEFFQYLLAHDTSRTLGLELAEVCIAKTPPRDRVAAGALSTS